jgi:hypothetical protein
MMLLRMVFGEVDDVGGLPKNFSATKSCLVGSPAIGLVMDSNLGATNGLPTPWIPIGSLVLEVRTISVQPGYEKSALSILRKFTLLTIISSPVAPNCHGFFALRVLIQVS